MAGFAISLLFTLWYNKMVSGSPFMFPFNVYDADERIGFGQMLDNLRYTHTPLKGLQNLLVSLARMNLWFLGIPLSLLFLLPALLGGEWTSGIRWCVAVISSFFIAYIFYYSPGVPDTGPVYYFELLLPFSLLSSRSILLLYGRLKETGPESRLRFFLPAFLIFSLILSFITFYPEKMLHIVSMTDKIKEPYDLVESRVKKPALVFIRSLPRIGWVFGYRNTDPWLKAPLIYCRDLGADKNVQVIGHFPDRNYYILAYNPDKLRSELLNFSQKDLQNFLKSQP
jgi:hypothetical protein